jgi:protein gp37
MLREWATDILRQCRKAGVPFFFKQWGGVNKKRAGRELNRRTYDEMPTVFEERRDSYALTVLKSG